MHEEIFKMKFSLNYKRRIISRIKIIFDNFKKKLWIGTILITISPINSIF